MIENYLFKVLKSLFVKILVILVNLVLLVWVKKKSYEAEEKKRTAVTGGRRGLDGGNLPFTFARHLRRMDGVSSAMTMTKTMKIQRQIQRFPLEENFL